MMGKSSIKRSCGGPCSHCLVTVTPCWRKGPPEKPILCNACGARYLVKRTLEGYMPGQRTTTKHKRNQQWNTQHKTKIHRNDTSSSGSSEVDLFDQRRTFRKNTRPVPLVARHRNTVLSRNEARSLHLHQRDKARLENEAQLAAHTLALLRCCALATTSVNN